jgi:exonuclease III
MSNINNYNLKNKKYTFKINYIGGKFQKNDFNKNLELAELIPYSDHAKMTEDEKLKNPYYCPDMFPFLCNTNSNAMGLCRKNKNDCNRTIISNQPNKVRIKYKEQHNELGNVFGYNSDNLGNSCYKWHLIYQKKFDQQQPLPQNFKIMTMNIWGLSKENMREFGMMDKRMVKISELINDQNADIVCLQEMSNTSFGILNPLVDPSYFRSEDIFLNNDELKSQRNRTLDCFAYLKYKPIKVEIYSVGGNVGYDNSVLLIEYSDTIIFNVYFQSGSKHSPGQEENAVHYSRCRREQYEMIGRQINENYPDKKIIVCGDFNTHLDGSESDWPEIKQINKIGLIDTFRKLNPDNRGYTEDTNINKMRWNIKFMEKKFRYDAILVKNLSPISCNIIGTEPFDLTEDETEIIKNYLRDYKFDLTNLRYKSGTNNILEWWPSDHFGLVCEINKLN